MDWFLRLMFGITYEEAVPALHQYWTSHRSFLLILYSSLAITGLVIGYLDLALVIPRLPGPCVLIPHFHEWGGWESIGERSCNRFRPISLYPLLAVLPALLVPASASWPTNVSIRACLFARKFWSLVGLPLFLTLVIAADLASTGLGRTSPFQGYPLWLWIILALWPVALPVLLVTAAQKANHQVSTGSWTVVASLSIASLLTQATQWFPINTHEFDQVKLGEHIGLAVSGLFGAGLLVRRWRPYWYLVGCTLYASVKVLLLWLAPWIPLPALASLSGLGLVLGLSSEPLAWYWTGG
jgi:hypothetical protein